MRMKKSHGITILVCLTMVCFGLSLVNCGGGSSGSVKGITKIEITSRETPAFEGHVFGDVGTYDRIKGVAYGVIDPKDPRNQIITDIALAPKNKNGMVEYEAPFYILTPTDPSKGNKKVFYEPPNRGNKVFGGFNQSGGGNDVGNLATDASAAPSTFPRTTTPTYPGFLFNQGYTVVWSAWDMEHMGTPTNMITAKLPVAINPDGSSITGQVYDYLVADNPTTKCFATYYSPASEDTTQATLTKRQYFTDTPPVSVASSDWKWNGTGTCNHPNSQHSNSISLVSDDPFDQSWIYELTYTAKDPYVAGAGLAAIRDFISFLRYSKTDTEGNANPLAGNVTRVMALGLSQSARMLNDYVWLGFNEDINKRTVFDSVFNWVGGGSGAYVNFRFAQVGFTERTRQHHLSPEAVFPFSYTTTTDPFTGKTDGRNVRCTASKTCPKIMNISSSNELWVKAASLLTTDPATGLDVVEPANVRNYVIAGSEHGGADPSTCEYLTSLVDSTPVLRALWVALDKWVSSDIPPPASKVPSVDDGTAALVPIGGSAYDEALNALGSAKVPLDLLDFQAMPVDLMSVFSGLVTVRNLWNFGPNFNQGILDYQNLAATGNYYAVSVPKVDANGNELGGIRLPELIAPFGSNVGWNLRNINYGGKADGTDGCEGYGSFIPFALNNATKITGDERLSLEGLYGAGGLTPVDWKTDWLAKRAAAAQELYEQGFLLENDRDNYTTSGALPLVIGTNPNYSSPAYDAGYAYTW